MLQETLEDFFKKKIVELRLNPSAKTKGFNFKSFAIFQALHLNNF